MIDVHEEPLKTIDLDSPAIQKVFAKMVGISEPAVSDYVKKNVLKKGDSYHKWILSYCSRQRKFASNNAGDIPNRMSEARIEELNSRTKLNHLKYLRELKTLVPAELATQTLIDWAAYTNRTVTEGLERIILELAIQHKIEIDDREIKKSGGKIICKIKEYAIQKGKELMGDEP